MDRFARNYVLATAVFGLIISSAITAGGVAHITTIGLEAAIVKADSESQGAAVSTAVSSKAQTLHDNKRRLSDLSTDVLKKAQTNRKSSAKDKATTLAALRTSLQARKKAMIDSIKNDPEGFLTSALPQESRDQLPAEVSDLVEKDVDTEGTLTVTHIDYPDQGKDEYVYTLDDKKNNKKYTLHFAKGQSNLFSGTQVKVRGVAEDSDLVLADTASTSIQSLALGGTTGTTAVAASIPSSLGERTALIIPVNFSDQTTADQYFSQAELDQMMFSGPSSVNSFYQENSFGQTWFTGVVAPWVSIPSKMNGSCDPDRWATEAMAAARALGFVTTNYKHVQFILAQNTANTCTWAGLGNLGGGSPALSWVLVDKYRVVYNVTSTMAHELGHNLGFYHASSISCGTRQIDTYSACTRNEYGDRGDFMGSLISLSNPAHKTIIPWIPTTNIQTVTTSGTYTLNTIDQPASGVQVIKIAKPDTSETYYIGYHLPSRWNNATHTFNPGVVVDIQGSANSYEVDTVPDQALENAGLEDGRSFYDVTNGVTVTQVNHTATTATVQITFGAITCTAVAPTVSIAPLTKIGAAGQTLSYNVSITNNDSYACPNPTFGVNVSDLPAGFTASSTSVVVVAGKTVTVPIGVMSAVSATDGSNLFTVTANDATKAGHNGSSQATYVVSTDTKAPKVTLAPDMLNGIFRSFAFLITATDDVSVVKTELYQDDVLVSTDTLAPYTASVPLSQLTEGVHSYQAKAYDFSGNVGTSSIVSGIVDLTNPSLTITSPVSGSQVSGVVSMTADATDANGITGVDFYADTKKLGSDKIAPYSWSWDTSTTTNGTHSLKFVATDKGSRTTTVTYSVTVQNVITNDTTPPTVSVTTPFAGAVLSGVSNVSLTAADNDRVSKVEFYVDGVVTFSTTTGPYNFIWDTKTITNGAHTLLAKAYDPAGNVGASASMSVTISNAETVPPSAPQNLVGTAFSTTQVNLSWSASTDNVGVTGYKVYRNGTLVKSVTSTSASDTGLLPNTSYSYTVSAYDLAGNISPQSNTVVVTTFNPTSDPIPPVAVISVPQNGSTISGTILIKTTATDNVGVVKLELYLDGVYQTANIQQPLIQSNWITTQSTNGSHTVMSKAYDAVGNVGTATSVVTVANGVTPPPSDTTAPSVPANLSASATSNQVSLSWSASTDNLGVTGYKVFRNGTQVALTVSPNYTDTSVAAATTYTYRVAAYDAAGNVSAQSSAKSVSTPAVADTNAPSTPANLTGNAVSSTQINLSWSASSDNVAVVGYKLFRNGVQFATSTGTSFSNTTVSPSTTYTYAVAAYDAAGNVSAQSSVVTVTTPAAADTTAPSVPTGLSGSAVSATQVNLSWSASTDNVGVTGYKVFRNGTQIGTSVSASFSNTTASPATTYTYTVAANDAAGNTSAQSTSVTVTTPAAADTTLPVTSVTSPVSGATLSNTVTVAASATDNVGVTKVDLYVDGAFKATTSAAPYSFSIDTKTLTNGTHTLQTKAYDVANNVGSSVSVSVTVSNTTTPPADTVVPTISFSSLTNGATISGSAIPLNVTASDNVGVTKVQFYVGSTFLFTDTAAPYTYSWNSTRFPNGVYSLTAKALDAAGNTGTITVSVTTANAADTTKPTVSLNSPVAGAVYTVAKLVPLTIVGSDNTATAKAWAVIDGVAMGACTPSVGSNTINCSGSWTATGLGSHTVVGVVSDIWGNVATSSPITITVQGSSAMVDPTLMTAAALMAAPFGLAVDSLTNAFVFLGVGQ